MEHEDLDDLQRPIWKRHRNALPPSEPLDDYDSQDDNGDDEIDARPKLRKNPEFKKNPSEMSLRAAKRVWFSPRKSGRPSSELSERLEQAKRVIQGAGESLKRIPVRRNKLKVEPKKARGRPRKNPIIEKIQRPRGRPRKNPAEKTVQEVEKRPRGRPRKNPVSCDVEHLKRPRGRPRKNPNPDEQSKKKT